MNHTTLGGVKIDAIRSGFGGSLLVWKRYIHIYLKGHTSPFAYATELLKEMDKTYVEVTRCNVLNVLSYLIKFKYIFILKYKQYYLF